ncbi:MAG: hypothetical protein EOP06_06055, partial [Proteobacteria bacterium]
MSEILDNNSTKLIGKVVKIEPLFYVQKTSAWVLYFNLEVEEFIKPTGKTRFDIIPLRAFGESAQELARVLELDAEIGIIARLNRSTWNDKHTATRNITVDVIAQNWFDCSGWRKVKNSKAETSAIPNYSQAVQQRNPSPSNYEDPSRQRAQRGAPSRPAGRDVYSRPVARQPEYNYQPRYQQQQPMPYHLRNEQQYYDQNTLPFPGRRDSSREGYSDLLNEGREPYVGQPQDYRGYPAYRDNDPRLQSYSPQPSQYSYNEDMPHEDDDDQHYPDDQNQESYMNEKAKNAYSVVKPIQQPDTQWNQPQPPQAPPQNARPKRNSKDKLGA